MIQQEISSCTKPREASTRSGRAADHSAAIIPESLPCFLIHMHGLPLVRHSSLRSEFLQDYFTLIACKPPPLSPFHSTSTCHFLVGIYWSHCWLNRIRLVKQPRSNTGMWQICSLYKTRNRFIGCNLTPITKIFSPQIAQRDGYNYVT